MSTIRIMGLAVVAMLSIIPMAKPVTPALSIQFHSQSIAFIDESATVLCSPTSTPVTIYLENFTEQLSGRDAGSTWVTFNSNSGGFLTKSNGLESVVCSNFNPLNAAVQVVVPTGSVTWRVSTSGSYVVSQTSNSVRFIAANETWTVTTIS